MTEGWGGLDYESSVVAENDQQNGDDDGSPINILLSQRDVMVREIAALKNRVAGLEMAITILREGVGK